MPIGVLLVITLAFLGIKRGFDTPVALVGMALGDRSNGTILEDPVNMVGNFVDQIWKVAVQVFERSGSEAAAVGLHAAQLTGLAG